MVDRSSFFNANTCIQVDYISKNSLSHSLTLSPRVSVHILGVFSNFLGVFSLFKPTVENQVLSSQVMQQLPSTRRLGGIKPATESTPKSKCFISAIAHPLLMLGQWATSFLLQERQEKSTLPFSICLRKFIWMQRSFAAMFAVYIHISPITYSFMSS